MELPEGSFYLRITADGYHDAVISDVEIASATDTVIDINLVLDTGVAASLFTEDTVIIGTKEVEVTIIADSLEDAALMMISEDVNFVNASWVPVESVVDFTFAEYGLNTLYVKFATYGGLESAPYSVEIILCDQSITCTATEVESPIYSVNFEEISGTDYTYSILYSDLEEIALIGTHGLGEGDLTIPYFYVNIYDTDAHIVVINVVDTDNGGWERTLYITYTITAE